LPQPDEPTTRGPRRTQAERSRDTRSKVCEATLQALAEVGHERISTSMIAERAGVSRGALTHQFPMRDDLLVAAFAYMLGEWRQALPFALDPSRTRISVDELTEQLWQNLFSQKHYAAALELMLAARLSTGLGHALRDVLESWIRQRDNITVRLIGDDPDDPEAMLRVQLNHAVLRGIAVHRSFDQDAGRSERLVELWKQILLRETKRCRGRE